MLIILSYLWITFGLFLWFWGTIPLLGQRSVLFKLHTLSVGDTLGSISILVGLLLRITREWPLVILGLICLTLWNTMLGYVIAYTASQGGNRE